MQNGQPDLHIIGHWNYPAGTKKTVYIAANQGDQVELFLNGKPLGAATKPCQFVDTYDQGVKTGAPQDDGADTGFIYAFPDIVFSPGTLKAVATRSGKIIAQQEIQTAGEPKALKLTVHTGPQGLQADGSDVALIDFEVVDAQGRRCPTDEARVDFEVTGPAVWRGGLNAAKPDSTNNLYLDTECGINRVAVRSTMTPGEITVTARRRGLAPATVKIDSKPVEIAAGLERSLPPTLPAPASVPR